MISDLRKENYSKREIDIFIHEIKDKLQTVQNVLELKLTTFEADTRNSLMRLEVQAAKTNGNVRWTEKMIYIAFGGLGVLSIIVIPLLLALVEAGKI